MRNEHSIINLVNLTNEEKEYFELQEQISDLLIVMIGRRIDLKMSQREFAKACGIKQPMIARIERMDATPRIDTLIKMCNALGLRIVIEKDDKKENQKFDNNAIIYNGKAYKQKEYSLQEKVERLEKSNKNQHK